MIDIRHLRYFVMVADELHFGRAAERLHMNQSPLSRQIRELERELNVKLVDRAHHVAGLTDAGKAFLLAAKTVLDDLDEAVHVAQRAGRGEFGTLCVGYVSEVTADLLPLSLKAFKDRYPDVELDLRQGTTGQLLEGLRLGQIDVSFVRSPGLVGDYEYEQLIVEQLLVALPHGHPASNQVCSLADLAAEKFVLPSHEAAQGLRKDINASFSGAGFQPDVSREASPLTTVLLHVAAGAGVALVPASVVHSYPVPGVAYAHLDEPAPTTTAGMAWRIDETSNLVGNLLAVTRELARRYEGQRDVWPERHIRQGKESDPLPPC